MHGVVRKLSESGIFGCNGWRKRHFGCVYWKRIKVDVDMKTKKTHERVRLVFLSEIVNDCRLRMVRCFYSVELPSQCVYVYFMCICSPAYLIGQCLRLSTPL